MITITPFKILATTSTTEILMGFPMSTDDSCLNTWIRDGLAFTQGTAMAAKSQSVQTEYIDNAVLQAYLHNCHSEKPLVRVDDYVRLRRAREYFKSFLFPKKLRNMKQFIKALRPDSSLLFNLPPLIIGLMLEFTREGVSRNHEETMPQFAQRCSEKILEILSSVRIPISVDQSLEIGDFFAGFFESGSSPLEAQRTIHNVVHYKVNPELHMIHDPMTQNETEEAELMLGYNRFANKEELRTMNIAMTLRLLCTKFMGASVALHNLVFVCDQSILLTNRIKGSNAKAFAKRHYKTVRVGGSEKHDLTCPILNSITVPCKRSLQDACLVIQEQEQEGDAPALSLLLDCVSICNHPAHTDKTSIKTKADLIMKEMEVDLQYNKKLLNQRLYSPGDQFIINISAYANQSMYPIFEDFCIHREDKLKAQNFNHPAHRFA